MRRKHWLIFIRSILMQSYLWRIGIGKQIDAQWTCFADIKKSFNSVDAVGNKRFVFNIKGNHFRIVALILFTPKILYIRFVGTHKEYDDIENIDKI